MEGIVVTETERVQGDKQNYCPCGCTLQDLDDNGYCHHLMGFTNDQRPGPGSEYEPRAIMRLGKRKTGPGHESIRFIKDKRKRPLVQKGDELVNPERIDIVGGIHYRVKAWVSTRVYRPSAVKPEPQFEDDWELESQGDVERMQQEIALLKQALAAKPKAKPKAKVRMTKPKGRRVEFDSGANIKFKDLSEVGQTPVGAE